MRLKKVSCQKAKIPFINRQKKRVDRFSYARAPTRYQRVSVGRDPAPYSKLTFNFLKPILLASQFQIIPSTKTQEYHFYGISCSHKIQIQI